jgi:aminoglycoside 6'-N-acetyltransferase I
MSFEAVLRKISEMSDLLIREAQLGDESDLAAMMFALWPDGSIDEHRAEAESLIGTQMCGTLPGTFFVAVGENQQLRGFIQVGLRSHADGCDVARPVGYIEGWFVDERFRGRGLGRRLLEAAEQWSRRMNCKEIASDALLDNEVSQRVHHALGFEVVDRCVTFRKPL